MEIIQIVIGQIRALRKASNISQKEMAAKIDLHYKNYGKLERGERKRLDLSLLVAIANALETDLSKVLVPLTVVDSVFYNQQEISDSKDDSIHDAYQQIIDLLGSIIKNRALIITELNQFPADRVYIQA